MDSQRATMEVVYAIFYLLVQVIDIPKSVS